VPCACFRAPRFSAASVCPILVSLFRQRHRYAAIEVRLSTAKSSRPSRDLACSLKTHSSSGRYSHPDLSKRQKLVIAPVKLKRMVPARWMIPNDANISEASALIAITAPELTQPQPCGRQSKRMPGSEDPGQSGRKLQDFGTVRHHSDVPAVRARCVARIALDIGYAAAGETQANSIRVPPGSRTIKCTLEPLPDRSGANSIMVPGHAATRSCKASSALRSATFNAR
jgi:hypothetical protein